MALNQIIQHQTGAYSSYWRVTTINLNYKDNIADIIILGYVDEQTRQSNKINLDQRNFQIQDTDFIAYFSITELGLNTNPSKQAYLYIKITPEFLGSTDV